jgi:hypothetical protein
MFRAHEVHEGAVRLACNALATPRAETHNERTAEQTAVVKRVLQKQSGSVTSRSAFHASLNGLFSAAQAISDSSV